MSFLEKHKKAFFITLASICVLAMALTIGNQISPGFIKNTLGFIITPFEKATTGTSRWIGGKLEQIFSLGTVMLENERLHKENEEMAIQLSRMKLVDAENERLASLLEIDRKYAEYSKTGALVIGEDPGNWFNSFKIDKGSRDGIEKNMPVLGAGGLIGRVLETGWNYSKIITLIDDQSSIKAKCTRTEDEGYVRGDIYLMNEGLCRMELIPADAQITVGDEIVTSRLSEVYPPGISIGFVTEIKDEGDGTKTAVIKPNTDLKHIETVLVITDHFDRTLHDTDPAITPTPSPAPTPKTTPTQKP